MSVTVWLSVLIGFNYIVGISHCVLLQFKYLANNNSDRLVGQTYKIKISELTHDILLERLNIPSLGLTIFDYGEKDPQLSTISNLPTCGHIIMSRIGQRLIPEFKNLPKIKRIYLEANDLVYIKKEAFGTVGVEKINLDKNNIFSIEDKSFGMKLRILTIQCNRIKEFSPKWFQNKTALEEIVLRGNEIQSIEENLFKDFRNLKTLDLGLNRITHIGQGAFSYSNNLDSIGLSTNLLRQLPTDIFASGQITIKSLGISENELTFLTKEFMKKVKVTHSAFMSGNPWQCKCYEEIREWIASDPNTKWIKGGMDQAICVAPEHNFKDNCIPFIDEEIINHYIKYDRDLDIPLINYCKK